MIFYFQPAGLAQ